MQIIKLKSSIRLKNFSLIMAASMVLSGCATYKTEFRNDPTFAGLSGDLFYVDVLDGSNMSSIRDSIFAKHIIDETTKWLSARGLKKTNVKRKAHTVLEFTAKEEEKNVYVPGQTYSIPVYGNNSTKSVVKNSFGRELGTIETTPSNPYTPSGYQTHYREGYSTTVRDRWLFLKILRHEHGIRPEFITQAQIYPEKYSQPFFEDINVVRASVTKLLSGSQLASNTARSIAASAGHDENKDPGCWNMLGIIWDMSKKSERGMYIQGFHPNSNGKNSGLKSGDLVISIMNTRMPASALSLPANTPVPVVIERDGTESTVQVTPRLLCD